MHSYCQFKPPGDPFDIVIDLLKLFAMTFELLLYLRKREYLLQVHPVSLQHLPLTTQLHYKFDYSIDLMHLLIEVLHERVRPEDAQACLELFVGLLDLWELHHYQYQGVAVRD